MNARMDMYSPDEVAKSVGVTSATICNWCREGLIKCNNVGEGTKANRYEIEESEYRYLRDLARKYGPKKVLLYYKFDRDNELPSIELSKEYSSVEASKYLGVNHDGLNFNCRTGRINCRVEESIRKGYKIYFIPGWELVYLRNLYDKYGRKGGKGSALNHYIKDRNLRGDKDVDMSWSLDMDQVEEKVAEAAIANHNGVIDSTQMAREVKYMESTQDDKVGVIDYIREQTEPDTVAKKILDKSEGALEEPSDDKLLDSFIRVRELKKDIDNMEAKLNQMKNEYAELKGEIVAWL